MTYGVPYIIIIIAKTKEEYKAKEHLFKMRKEV
nr:MAG TPA: hypothetical protein [Caudoviricetes sp.]